MDDINKEFQEYIERRTRYAFDVAARKYPGLIDFGNGFLELLQAQWAREFWFDKCVQERMK